MLTCRQKIAQAPRSSAKLLCFSRGFAEVGIRSVFAIRTVASLPPLGLGAQRDAGGHLQAAVAPCGHNLRRRTAIPATRSMVIVFSLPVRRQVSAPPIAREVESMHEIIAGRVRSQTGITTRKRDHAGHAGHAQNNGVSRSLPPPGPGTFGPHPQSN